MKHSITPICYLLASLLLLLALPTPASALTKHYNVEINKGRAIRLATPVTSIAVANPDIADVQVISPHLLYMNGHSIGETSVIAVGENDGVILQANIAVTHNLSKLRRAVKKAVKNSDVSIDSTDGAIVLNGSVASPYVAERVQRLATTFLGEEQSVINMLETAQGDQVMLKIKIAEVSRTELKRFGIRLESLLSAGNLVLGTATGANIVGNLATGLLRNGNDNAIAGAFSSGSTDITGVVDMLADDGLMTVLAEPNLTTKSGVQASFLAGGEFPIPVSGEEDTVTIQYRPFGVSLNFTPVVMDERKISLTVAPEVSSLSNTNAVEANGFSIPSIITRRVSTTVDVGSGESFAIAGLLSRNDINDIDKVPGLGDIPIIGALFRSSEFRQEQTELVIIVTPYIVRPVSANQKLATPLDAYHPPHESNRILRGKLYEEKLSEKKREEQERQQEARSWNHEYPSQKRLNSRYRR